MSVFELWPEQENNSIQAKEEGEIVVPICQALVERN